MMSLGWDTRTSPSAQLRNLESCSTSPEEARKQVKSTTRWKTSYDSKPPVGVQSGLRLRFGHRLDSENIGPLWWSNQVATCLGMERLSSLTQLEFYLYAFEAGGLLRYTNQRHLHAEVQSESSEFIRSRLASWLRESDGKKDRWRFKSLDTYSEF